MGNETTSPNPWPFFVRKPGLNLLARSVCGCLRLTPLLRDQRIYIHTGPGRFSDWLGPEYIHTHTGCPRSHQDRTKTYSPVPHLRRRRAQPCLRIMTRTGARSRLPTISLSSTASGSLVLSTTALATSFSRTLNQTHDIAASGYEEA